MCMSMCMIGVANIGTWAGHSSSSAKDITSATCDCTSLCYGVDIIISL